MAKRTRTTNRPNSEEEKRKLYVEIGTEMAIDHNPKIVPDTNKNFMKNSKYSETID